MSIAIESFDSMLEVEQMVIDSISLSRSPRTPSFFNCYYKLMERISRILGLNPLRNQRVHILHLRGAIDPAMLHTILYP